MNGSEQIQQFERAGFSPEEISQWATQQREQLASAGFQPGEITAWFGEPDTAAANASLAKYTVSTLENLGHTVKSIATVYGPIEAALNVATGITFGFPTYLGTGAGTLIARGLGLSKDDPKEIASKFSHYMTYQPQTEAGQWLSPIVNLPFTKLMEVSETAGQKVTDITGSPTAGALTEATIQMLPAPLIGALGRRIAGEAPTKNTFDTTAQAMAGGDAEVAAVLSEKMKSVYKKTGLDPQALFEAAEKDPSILQDLASDNLPVPRAFRVPPEKPPEPLAATVAREGPPRSEAANKVLARIVTDETAPARGVMQTLHDWYTEYVDRLHPIKLAQTEAGLKTGEIGPYEVQRLTAGIAGKAKQFIEFGAFDAETYQNVGPSYKAVLNMAGEDPQGFTAYIVAKHAIEREAAGKATGIDLEAARQVVDEGAAKFESASVARVRYKNALLDYAQKSGILSEDAVSAMHEAYQAHVPFYRFFEGEPRTAGGAEPRSPVKRAIGSERLILDPIKSDILDTYLFLSLSEHNMARQALVGQLPQFVEKLKTAIRPIGITEDEVARFFKENGIQADPAAFTAFRPSSHIAGRGELAVFEDGKRVLYQLDPELARAYEGLDAAQASALSSMLRSTANWLRAGVTLSPDFSLRNIVRDAMSAFIYAGSHPIKTARGAIALWQESEPYQSWLKGGGGNAAMVSIQRRYIDQHLYAIEPETHLMEKAWNVAKSPFEALAILSETLENVTRLGIAVDELATAKTKAQIQALSMLTREGTVDFARHGADPFFYNWTRATAFMNPALQGVDRMMRAFQDNPVGTTAKALAAITLPSVLLWWANKDDPRWKEIPDWERDLFWIVMTQDHIYRIPKPFELGVLFGSLPERILDAYVKDKPDAFKHFAQTLVNVFGFNVVPTVLLPPFQQMTNFSLFTDRPIVPDSMKHILPEYQFLPYTTEATKALGHIIGSFPGMHDSNFASPLMIDNYIRGWTGTLGAYVVQGASYLLQKAGALPEPILPAQRLEDLPVIKAFTIRYPAATAQSIQDFYDQHEKTTKIVQTVRHLAALGDAEAALKEWQLAQDLVRLDGIHSALGHASQVVQLIAQNPRISADEKRQLIDAVYGQMIVLARTGLEMMQAPRRPAATRDALTQSTR